MMGLMSLMGRMGPMQATNHSFLIFHYSLFIIHYSFFIP